jgi:hypothetical protein
MKDPGRRHARLLLGAIALAVLACGAVNSTVNPWRVTPVPWQAASLEPYRGEADHLRTRKAGLLRSGDWGVALVGSSRTANGFDPDLPGWGRGDVVNLGCSAAFLHESTAIARHFLEHEKAELIVFGVDPGDLTSPVDTRPMFDFTSSPFAPGAGVERELRYVFGLSTLDSSLKTLAKARRGETGEYGPKGMRSKPKQHGRSLLKFIATTIAAKTQLETADAAGPGRSVNEQKLAKLRELAVDCRRRGCRLVLFYQPNHALMHAEAAHRGSGVIPFEAERRLLVDLVEAVIAEIPAGAPVELWDFCNYHPLHCEPLPLDDPQDGRMKHWSDLGHFTPEVGAEMLAMMLGWPRQRPEWDGIGRRLDRAALEDYLAETAAGYQRYLGADGARDVAWKEQVKAKSAR